MKANIKIGTKYTLNDMEQLIVQSVSEKRFQNNRNKNVKNSRIGDQSDESTDREGFGAEMAFCKLFNVYPDFSIEPRSSNDDKGDAILPIETRGSVDVKSTKYRTGRLITPTWKKKGNVDYYALMIGEFPSYEFRGFMGAEKLMQEDRVRDMGYGKNSYVAEQDELQEIEMQ